MLVCDIWQESYASFVDLYCWPVLKFKLICVSFHVCPQNVTNGDFCWLDSFRHWSCYRIITAQIHPLIFVPIQDSSLSQLISYQLSTVSKLLQIQQNTEEFQTLVQIVIQTTLKETESVDNPAVVCHTIYLTITVTIKSRRGPEEKSVMTDTAPSWGTLQKVWVNSLVYGLRRPVPMGTYYQGTHSSQQHLCKIWLTADKHQEHLTLKTLFSKRTLCWSSLILIMVEIGIILLQNL